ncbi:hypothetical protein NQZ79_g4283 [Umbelopsis isabellina]|nr:hypothetical protein NQZ79_g4283 [Umbelopsis isabellina]
MEVEANKRAKQLLDTVSRSSNSNKYILGVSGIPGSGKTTFVNQLVQIVNNEHKKKGSSQDIAIAVSMDGYHLPKAALDKLENPQEAHARRGAHFTFDPNGIIELLNTFKDPANQNTIIKAPSFDHAKGDPVADDIEIYPHHKIIIMEGIYLQLVSPEPWNHIPLFFDEMWFIEVDTELARLRTGQRHFAAGLEPSLEAGIQRFDRNDLLNVQFILANRDIKAQCIKSVQEKDTEADNLQ